MDEILKKLKELEEQNKNLTHQIAGLSQMQADNFGKLDKRMKELMEVTAKEIIKHLPK